MRHICFSVAGAGTLQRTLHSLGRREDVLHFLDDLSMGPVADVCGEDRHRWMLDYFSGDGFSDFGKIWAMQVDFWERLPQLAEDGLTVWISRRSTLEYSCFLEFLSRLPAPASFHIADFTERELRGFGNNPVPHKATTVGIMAIDQWIAGMEAIRQAAREEFRGDLELWARLKGENAPLRVFTGGHLVSAPADHYDGDILASVWPAWRRTLRVVGECLAYIPGQNHYAQIGDLLILRRMETMAREGLIEFRGRPGNPAFEVRLKDTG